MESERVTAVDSSTARALRQSLWANKFVAYMPWRAANLSRLLPVYRAKGLVPDSATLVQQCLEMYQQAQALEDEHQRGMPRVPTKGCMREVCPAFHRDMLTACLSDAVAVAVASDRYEGGRPQALDGHATVIRRVLSPLPQWCR